MAYDERLAERIREALVARRDVEEKKMMGGLAFMVSGKMCVGIIGDELMARIGPAEYDAALTRRGCREMDFTGRPMKGYVFVGSEGIRTKGALAAWIDLALRYNKSLPAAKKSGSSKGRKGIQK
jgi:TfoX/Sxy family transcriptional regulator of competence genes